MIWMQGSVSHAASLRIRARSLALWLLFICHKRQHTHRRTHSTQLWCAFPSSLLLSRLSHTHAHTHFRFSSSCPDTLLFLFDTHILPLPGKCSCDLLLPPDLSPQSPPHTHTQTHTHAAIVCFISPFSLLTSLVFYCRKLLLHSCVFIICSDRKGPLSVCVCVCVLPSVAFSRDSSHTHYAALFVALSNCYLFHAHAHTHMQKACMTAASLHTHTFSHSFFCSCGAHTFVVWVLYEIVRGCVCVWERVRACQVVRE